MGAVRLFFHGQLQIRAYGRDPERFLNLCAGTGVTLYNMKRKEDDVCFVLSVPVFAGQFLWRGRAARSYISAVGLAFHFFCIGTAQEKLTLPVCFWAFFCCIF